MPREWKLVFVLILLVLATLLVAIFSIKDSTKLVAVACDVGQGDSILIQHQSSQILVDGGPGNRAVDCLSKYMPFWDRKIELIVLTHPQADHYEGLIEVIRRYKVDYLLASSVNNSTEGYEVLKNEVGVRQITVLNPDPTKDISIGLIYLDVLYPEKNNNEVGNNVLGSFDTGDDLNDFSIVIKLNYKDFSMLLTGDIGPNVENELLNAGLPDIDVIKVPHHGSKNGLTEKILEKSDPEVAVISVGHRNRFGHPHPDVLKLLDDNNVEVLRTDIHGDVVITTDGQEIWY